MSHQLETLRLLPVNKTVVFYSPVEGKDVLVRTGTIAEGSCFVAGTRVYTNRGVKNIEDVEIGDEVITHTGKLKRVLQLHKNSMGDRKLHSLNVYKTPEIKVTNNHRFIAVKKTDNFTVSKPSWVRTDNLDGSYYIMVPKKKSFTCDNMIDIKDLLLDRKCDEQYEYTYKITENTVSCSTMTLNGKGNVGDKCSQKINRKWVIDGDFCEFLGIWYGDGSILTSKRMFDNTQKGISIVSRNENESLIKFVVDFGTKLFGIKPNIYKSEKQNLVQITFNSTLIGFLFEKLFGKGFTGKTLPAFLYKQPPEFINCFVTGLISTDGCIDSNLNVSLCLSNPLLIEELYHICRSIGLGVSASYRQSQSGKLTGYISFLKDGLLLDRIKKYYNDNRMNELLEYENNTHINSYVNVDGILYMRVLSVDTIEEKHEFVYTLGVEDDHSYVVEGLVVENCFFHALLHAYSKEYASMDIKGRLKFVQKLRASIARKVDKERWENLSNGLIAKIPFQENVNTLLSDFYRYVARGKSGRTKSVRKVIRNVIDDEKQDIGAYKLITEMIPIDTGFEKTILPSAYDKCAEEVISKCKTTVVQFAVNYYIKEFKKLEGQLEPERVDFYIGKLEKLVQEIVDEAENSAYTEYIESLRDSSMEVDSYTIGLISDKFNRDIYFIDARTRMPYRDTGKENIKKRKSIIVMWTGGCHYEIVGRLLHGNKIKREFDHKDPLIKCVYTYLYRPRRVPDEYPNLTSFLPKEIREELGVDISDSEKDRRSQRSDRSYESEEEFLSSDDREMSSA